MKTVTFDETKWKLVPIEPNYFITKTIETHIKKSIRNPPIASLTDAYVLYADIMESAPEHKEE